VAIEISNRQSQEELNVELYKSVAGFVLENENVADNAEISISFVTDEEIRFLNSRYRGIDEPTDVLSFCLDDGPKDPHPVLGDVVIAPKVAGIMADKLGCPLNKELSFLLIHGILHLLGYSHKDDKKRKAMQDKEHHLLDLVASRFLS